VSMVFTKPYAREQEAGVRGSDRDRRSALFASELSGYPDGDVASVLPEGEGILHL
jgi:hypothetical protein